VNESSVLKCSDIGPDVIDGLLSRYSISSAWVAAGLPLTGSYWGAPEAGIVGQQVLLADHLPCVGRQRLMQDMDAWGYSFRPGSTRRWFNDDAEDAQAWLRRENLVTAAGEPLFRLRE